MKLSPNHEAEAEVEAEAEAKAEALQPPVMDFADNTG